MMRMALVLIAMAATPSEFERTVTTTHAAARLFLEALEATNEAALRTTATADIVLARSAATRVEGIDALIAHLRASPVARIDFEIEETLLAGSTATLRGRAVCSSLWRAASVRLERTRRRAELALRRVAEGWRVKGFACPTD